MPSKRTSRLDLQTDLDARTLSGLVEAGMLMANADGVLRPEEIEAVASVIDGFLDGNATGQQIREIIEAFQSDIERDGFDARLDALAGNLATEELRDLALQVAAAVLVADGEYVLGEEDEVFFEMADALDVSEDRATTILDSVADQFE